jgi:hypothetical protein
VQAEGFAVKEKLRALAHALELDEDFFAGGLGREDEALAIPGDAGGEVVDEGVDDDLDEAAEAAEEALQAAAATGGSN